MKSRGYSIPLSVFILVAIFASICTGMSVKPANAIMLYDYFWTDDFNQNDNDSLHPLWNWVREDSIHWSLETNPGYMTIITQPGGIYQDYASDQRNLLLTHIPDQDFQIETKLSFEPTWIPQHAALLIYQDDDNYVEINRAYTSGPTINLDIETNGVAISTIVSESATNLCFRLRRSENTYSGWYSTDCLNWNFVGSGEAHLRDIQVGIGASNNYYDPAPLEIPARFDYFYMNGNFPDYNLSISEQFSATTLDPMWQWVNEDSNYWSLTEDPGHMQIVTAELDTMRNALIQPAQITNYWIETLLDFTPYANFQIGYLLLYHDEGNMMKFGRAYCNVPSACVGNGIYFDALQDWTRQPKNYATVVTPTDFAYLRVLKEKDTYFAFFKSTTPGSAWQLIGRHDWMGSVRLDWVGISSDQNQNPIDYPNQANFDYFDVYSANQTFIPMLTRVLSE